MRSLLAQPRRFVARLIVSDLIAKRGEGPLERKMLIYKRRRR
jgi:hypothetical protein